MNKFLHHLKSKGYEINGNTAMLLGVKFKICNGTIKTARGLKNSYWLELAWNDDFRKGENMNNNGKIKLELTSKERSILSNGLICLIDNVYKAEKLTCETSVIKALDESAEIYQRLNKKICNSISRMEW